MVQIRFTLNTTRDAEQDSLNNLPSLSDDEILRSLCYSFKIQSALSSDEIALLYERTRTVTDCLIDYDIKDKCQVQSPAIGTSAYGGAHASSLESVCIDPSLLRTNVNARDHNMTTSVSTLGSSRFQTPALSNPDMLSQPTSLPHGTADRPSADASTLTQLDGHAPNEFDQVLLECENLSASNPSLGFTPGSCNPRKESRSSISLLTGGCDSQGSLDKDTNEDDPITGHANTSSARSPYNKQMVEPPPASSSPTDVTNSENRQNSGKKHDNSSQRSLVPGELPCSPQGSNNQYKGLSTVASSCLEEDENGSPLADTHLQSSYDHSISSNCTKTDNPAAEQTCSNDTSPKSTKSRRQLAKRPAKHHKETASKKKKTAATGQLPTINDCRFPAAEIYEYFANHCQNPNNSWLLTRLFFSVASQESFVQFKDAYHHLKSKKISIQFSWTSTVSEHMKSLDRLTASSNACYIMERCILVQLVNRRDELVKKYKAQPDRKFRQTAKAKNQLRLPRADGLGFSAMMEEAYPMVKERDDDYGQRQTTLRNKLSKGRNWQSSAMKFGIGVLPLVPIDGDFQLCDRDIQRIGESDFALFLQVLDNKRGNFIRMCSTHMGRLLDICYDSNLTGKCPLEEVDGCMVKLISYDSSDLVKLLEVE